MQPTITPPEVKPLPSPPIFAVPTSTEHGSVLVSWQPVGLSNGLTVVGYNLTCETCAPRQALFTDGNAVTLRGDHNKHSYSLIMMYRDSAGTTFATGPASYDITVPGTHP